MNSHYKLLNPRTKLAFAHIYPFIFENKVMARLYVVWENGTKSGDGYAHPSISAAKRYFGRGYQCKKYGYETPKWELIIEQ